MSEDIDQASAWEASKKLRQNLCVFPSCQTPGFEFDFIYAATPFFWELPSPSKNTAGRGQLLGLSLCLLATLMQVATKYLPWRPSKAQLQPKGLLG
jgi:hypothetical protein